MTDTGDRHDGWEHERRVDEPGAVATRPDNGRGLWAMILGIGGLVLAVIMPPIGLLVGIVAVILAVSGRRRVREGRATNGSQATAGLVTGIIAVVIGGLLTAYIGTVVWENRDEISDLNECLDQAETEAQEAECQEEFERQIS